MTKRERGQGGLFKNPNSTRWYAQWYGPDGRQHRVSTGTDVKQKAQAILSKLMVENANGATPITEVKRVTYQSLREALLDSYRNKGNKSLQTLADGSETIWGLKDLDDFFGDALATQITSDRVREFIRKRQQDGVGNATINSSLALLRRMFTIARKERKLQEHHAPHIELLKAPAARKGFLAPEDFARLLSALPRNLQPLVTLLYYTGVRLGEALQVEWPQVNLDVALIRLEAEQTKNSEARTVPLPNPLVEMLRGQEPKEGRVFDATNLRKTFHQACASVGLGTLTEVPGKPYDPRYEGLIIHDLRRSAVRNLIQAGAPQAVAMKISGHKTASVFQRYNIVDTAQVSAVMRRVEQLVPAPAKLLRGKPVRCKFGVSRKKKAS